MHIKDTRGEIIPVPVNDSQEQGFGSLHQILRSCHRALRIPLRKRLSNRYRGTWIHTVHQDATQMVDYLYLTSNFPICEDVDLSIREPSVLYSPAERTSF